MISIVATSGNVQVTRDGQSLSFVTSLVKRIRVEAGDGADSVTLGTIAVPATLLGQSGDDTLTGGDGADLIGGADGDDVIDGGGGNDTLTGGDGFDTVDYHRRRVGFTFEIGLDANDQVELGSTLGFAITQDRTERDQLTDLFEVISGSSKRDVFQPASTVAPQPDGVVALYGNGGNDYFASGTVNFDFARRIGGAGNDTFDVDENSYEISGGAGDDLVRTFDVSTGNLDGGPGIDTIDQSGSSEASDTLDLNLISNFENAIARFGAIGTPGPNRLELARSSPGGQLIGGGGNDTLIGSTMTDTLDGGAGDDSIDGAGGNDTINGGPGNDTLIGGPGRDRIYGADGNDTIFARDGVIDRIYGGGGTDAAQADVSALVTEVLSSIETPLA